MVDSATPLIQWPVAATTLGSLVSFSAAETRRSAGGGVIEDDGLDLEGQAGGIGLIDRELEAIAGR